ncbi:MAG: hypothetical protein Q8916_05250 [Bacteroidota bacterium]|nr:hypothetical protein [Bacteroidota bacterium]MDP4236291.1 hypothetical protein [Bacteroidota bacterium]
MNKRDTIAVVFRVVAVFIFFISLAIIPTLIWEWSLGEIQSSLGMKVIKTILVLGIPGIVIYLIWNRSDWIADKILAPFGMDELWVDETDGTVENAVVQESTITHLTRNEIESIALSVIGIFVFVNALPDFLARLIIMLTSGSPMFVFPTDYKYLVVPAMKLGFAVWLIFRANHLVSWLGRWRELRMKD